MTNTCISRILDDVRAMAFPGVYDTLSAKIAQQTGFPMAFVSGYSVAATTIGEPDLGLLTQTEMIDRARRICMSVDIPIIVDADTGYGNPLNVYRTVSELILAGADASFVEAPGSEEHLSSIGRRAPKPTVANMIEGGKTPVLPKQTLVEMGFQLILYPLTGLFAAAHAVESLYEKLKNDGTTLGHGTQLMPFSEFNNLVGVDEKYALGERFGVN